MVFEIRENILLLSSNPDNVNVKNDVHVKSI